MRVVEVPQADGSSTWVVVIPGTQNWSPRPGTNPSDLTSDVLLMAQQSALLAAGVDHALLQAQRAAGRAGRGDAVMLVGHSQGGIVATALAADPAFRQRQRVTHVVASGAPIARLGVPPEVSVLAIEHRQDAVPRLEGERNADRRGWVTVTRDLDGEPVARTAGAAHASGLYRATAALADASGSRSLADWRRGSAAFLAGPAAGTATVRDFRVARVGARPSGKIGRVNPSTAFATVLVDELIRCGVREAVLCPGSRSAPLAYALQEADRAGRLRLHVRVDERSAGFLALGLAKVTRVPAVVVTTSGTAVANLHPAVLEAHHAHVPLVVLSADRPPSSVARGPTRRRPSPASSARPCGGPRTSVPPNADPASRPRGGRRCAARSPPRPDGPPGFLGRRT